MLLDLVGVTHVYRSSGRGIKRPIDLRFGRGVTALLGPNGAGKSTLLRIAAGDLRPASGRVRCGTDRTSSRSGHAAVRRATGWVPQEISFIPSLTCAEQVAYAAWLKGRSRREAQHAAVAALGEVELADLADEKPRSLSGGQRRRLAVACALAHEPVVALLDEPAAGLDPTQRTNLRQLIRSIATHRAVVIATHQVDDIDQLCDRVVVLDDGQVRFDGDAEGFLLVGGVGPSRSTRERAESSYASLVASGER